MINHRVGIDEQIAVCLHCHKLNRITQLPEKGSQWQCSRCGSAISFRKTYSLQKTWAFVVASIILLFPANFLPITSIVEFGYGDDPDTIMSGIISLYEHQFFLIAFLIFVASIIVPILKIIGLIYLLLAVQLDWHESYRAKAVMYRMIEWIGRWSMLDIFVLAVLMAMINLGTVATVKAGPGATYFAAVVVLTMFAAESFDPRLIWQSKSANDIPFEQP